MLHRRCLIIAAVTVAALCAGCSDPAREAREKASWDATVRTTAVAWSQGSVSTRFAIDTLKTAGKRARTSQYDSLSAAIAKADRQLVRQILAQ